MNANRTIMKKNWIIYAFLLVAGLIFSSWTPDGKDQNFGQAAWEESSVPVHPGKPGKVPFWNGSAFRFIYAPAFDFPVLDKAVKYRYEIVSQADSKIFSFEDKTPYAPLSKVWKDMPVGQYMLKVTGISKTGNNLRQTGERTFYRAAPFNGEYHKPVMPYDGSALLALNRLVHKDYVNYWLIHRSPDPEYGTYRYPAKIMSALIVGAVTHARFVQDPVEVKRSTELACIIADYLIGISYPQSSVWPFFPPTYHGPRIGKNEKSHMQLVNNLTIMGADAGHAYLDLYELTGEDKYREAAIRIADAYLKNQLDNGSWYLYVNHETGEAIAPNIAIPTGVINYFERLQRDFKVPELKKTTKKALEWIMENPVKTFNWQAQFEDVKPFPPHVRQNREQACDLAMYLFRKDKKIKLAEELVRFAEDQFVIWENPMDFSVSPGNQNPGWLSKNWITPSAQEQYGFWMPVNRAAGIMIDTYWEAYRATGKEIYLAKARSIANAITLVQQYNDGDYPTMFIKTPWNLWLNSTVYPAKVMMNLARNLKQGK